MPDSTTTVAMLRESMARFVAERDWEQFHSPKNLAMALAAEAAELMEHFMWIDNDASRALVRDPAHMGPIADEIADVAGVIFALCNALGLDLSDAVAGKMSRNALKYPVEKCRGRYRVEEGDKETRRQGDKETRRQGIRRIFLLVSLSPCLPVWNRGWVVGHRRLTGSVVLGACLLFGAGRLFGQGRSTAPASAQREVIATTVPVASQTPPAPLPVPNTPPAAAPTPEAIQQASFIPDPPAASTSPSPSAAPAGTSMLAPNELFGGMKAGSSTITRPTNLPAASAATVAAVSVEVVGPDRLLLGKPLTHEIVLRNTGGRPVAELHVEEPLPAGARALKTDPPATTKDNRLTWDLRNLEAGGERRLKVELQPGRHVELDLRPYVTFLCGDGLRTKVTRPPFCVEMSADRDKAPRGGRIRFTIVVANHGEAPISNIYLYDQLPPGLHHPQGPKIRSEGFNLQPEETRTITLEATGVESGTFHNEVAAFADQGVEARTALDVVITEPSLSLRLDGPTQTVTQREEEFHLEASNPGTLPAKNILLVQALPPTVDVVSFSSGASLDSKQHALVWSLSDLTAGQRQTVTFRIRASLAGDWPLIAALQSQNLPETRANHMLHAEPAAALKLEVRAREERLAIGAETVFRVHVFNQGDAPCSGLRLTALLPEALAPLNAQGPTEGKVEKQRVSFAPLAQLDAHGDVVYPIHVRGRQVGKGSLRVELTADKQPPAQSEISIQVHGEEHAAAQAASSETAKSAPRETLR